MDIQVVTVVSRLVLLKVTNVSGGRRLVRYRSGSLDGDVQPPPHSGEIVETGMKTIRGLKVWK